MEDSDQEFTMADGKVGIYHWNVCLSCGWQSEKWWDNWTAERLSKDGGLRRWLLESAKAVYGGA